jgi:hypothetical protein
MSFFSWRSRSPEYSSLVTEDNEGKMSTSEQGGYDAPLHKTRTQYSGALVLSIVLNFISISLLTYFWQKSEYVVRDLGSFATGYNNDFGNYLPREGGRRDTLTPSCRPSNGTYRARGGSVHHGHILPPKQDYVLTKSIENTICGLSR